MERIGLQKTQSHRPMATTSKREPVILKVLLPSHCLIASLLLLGSACGAWAAATAKGTGDPEVYLFQSARLADLKAAYQAPSGSPMRPGSRELVKKTLSSADKAISHPVFTVTENTEKLKVNTQSHDPHDYFSIAPYFWPDPSKPDGVPYIRKDGEMNPRKKELSDQKQLDGMIAAVVNLAVAYHASGDEKYAAAAAGFLRGFFLDPATRMNPNLEYAQAILGENLGRGSGIIDAAGLSVLPDCIALISTSPAWTASDRKGMTDWWSTYAHWLQTSPHGIHERDNANNHGVYYDLQLGGVLLGAGKKSEARELLARSVPARMDRQINPNGEMPLEEARRTSWHYCNFNITAFTRVCLMAESLGLNIWNHEGPGGAGNLKKAMLFLICYLDRPKEWKFTQITEFTTEKCSKWLPIAAAVYDDPVICSAQEKYAPLDQASLLTWLIVPDATLPGKGGRE